jgi:hypothetical protein
MDSCTDGCPADHWCNIGFCYPCPEGTTKDVTAPDSIDSTWNPDCVSAK